MPKRKGGRRIKRKTQKLEQTADEESAVAPRAFVFAKGRVPAPLKQLVEDLKRVLMPNTARALRARKTNKLRDFVAVAGQLKVGFFLIVSATERAAYLRLCRSPRGPTLTFRVAGYSLAADVAASLRRPFSASDGLWQSAPLLVLDSFDKEVQHEALASQMLRNLMPTINAATINLKSCRRVLLAHKNEEGGIELRQYAIRALPTGVSRGVKRITRAKRLPSLARCAPRNFSARNSTRAQFSPLTAFTAPPGTPTSPSICSRAAPAATRPTRRWRRTRRSRRRRPTSGGRRRRQSASRSSCTSSGRGCASSW